MSNKKKFFLDESHVWDFFLLILIVNRDFHYNNNPIILTFFALPKNVVIMGVTCNVLINIINDQISDIEFWSYFRFSGFSFQIRLVFGSVFRFRIGSGHTRSDFGSDQVIQIRFRIRSGFFQIRSDLICSEP